MAMEVEPNSVDEKNEFLNRQDMAIGSISMSVSPKLSIKYMKNHKDYLQMNYGPDWRFYLGIKNIVNISCKRSNR
jgi:hypothetical protein